jgi:hypothetical protein
MALEAQNNPFTSVLMVEAADVEALPDADPAAGQRRLAVGTDHLLYLVSDSGVKTLVGGAGIANPLATDSLWDAAGDLVQGSGANTAAKLSAGTAGKVLTSNGAAAALTWETPSGSVTARAARSSRTTNQAISTATWTGVQMNVTDDYDSNSIHDTTTNNTRFVLNATGIWSVTLRAQFAGNGTGDRYLAVYLNGAQYGHPYRVPGNATQNTLEHADDVKATATTDYVELFVYQDSGGNLNISTASCAVAFLGV